MEAVPTIKNNGRSLQKRQLKWGAFVIALLLFFSHVRSLDSSLEHVASIEGYPQLKYEWAASSWLTEKRSHLIESGHSETSMQYRLATSIHRYVESRALAKLPVGDPAREHFWAELEFQPFMYSASHKQHANELMPQVIVSLGRLTTSPSEIPFFENAGKYYQALLYYDYLQGGAFSAWNASDAERVAQRLRGMTDMTKLVTTMDTKYFYATYTETNPGYKSFPSAILNLLHADYTRYIGSADFTCQSNIIDGLKSISQKSQAVLQELEIRSVPRDEDANELAKALHDGVAVEEVRKRCGRVVSTD